MAKYIDIENEALQKTVACGGLSARALWRRICNEQDADVIPISFIEKKIEEYEMQIDRREQSDVLVPEKYYVSLDTLEKLITDWRAECLDTLI